MPQPNKGGLIVLIILIFGIGLLSLFYPRLFWWLRIGRRDKDIAPVQSYILVLRIGGALTCAVALYLLYYIFYLI